VVVEDGFQVWRWEEEWASYWVYGFLLGLDRSLFLLHRLICELHHLIFSGSLFGSQEMEENEDANFFPFFFFSEFLFNPILFFSLSFLCLAKGEEMKM
jgi:hypothetical protein